MVSPTQPMSQTCPSCGAPAATGHVAGLCLGCVARRLGGGDERTSAGERVELPAGFEYVETLGRGGMGIVHLAYQRALRRYVAVKCIAAAVHEPVQARARFVREAQAAARLSHPGIVPILAIGDEGEAVWYAMEYLEGGDLAQMLARRGGRLSWPEAVALVAEAATAIAYAHGEGVAHRDLKPSNLLLDAQGRPKVADFGLAWLAAQEGRDLTLTGQILGTPSYLAPECLQGGAARRDARPADVYALTAILFHLVAGRPPVMGDTPLAVLDAIAHREVPSLRRLAGRAAVPGWLDALCAHGLAKDPAERIASAGALSEALLARRRLPRTRRLRSWLRAGSWRHGGLALGLALAGTAGWYTLRPEATAVALQAAPRVAVLPFTFAAHPAAGATALSEATPVADATTTALTAGLQDEVAATLVRLSDLRVIAAGSVRGAAVRDFRAARTALGADVVLTGSVFQAQDRLRFTLQLVDTADGTLRWSDSYERRETDLFNLQTDIATEVALRLKSQLEPSRARRSVGTSSRHPAAQRLFLEARALGADASRSGADLQRAEEMLAEATQLDPGFALAFAHRAFVTTRLHLWGHDRSDAVLARGLAAAQRALALNPDLPEAETALAMYYFRRSRDRESARPHLVRALGLAPHNPEVLSALASLERRSGDFATAARHYRSALELDPVNAPLAYNAADTLLRLREYETASRLVERTLALLPGNVLLMKLRGDLHVVWRGDLAAMREDMAVREPDQPDPNIYLMHRIDWLVLEGRMDEALQTLRASPLQALEGQSIYMTRAGYEAVLLQLAGDRASAATYAEAGYVALQPELARRPDDARLLLHAGQLLAILGNLRAAESLIGRTLDPNDRACADAFDRGYFQTMLAAVLAGAGEERRAVEIVRAVLREPNQLSVPYLRLHPAFARLAKEFP